MKPFMVENAIRRFEQQQIELSQQDQVLTRQLQSYIITKVSITGRPTYGLTDPQVGDHKLDALLLALLAFQMEKTQFGKARYATHIRLSGGLGEKVPDQVVKEVARQTVGIKEEMKAKDRTFSDFQVKYLGFPRRGANYASDKDHERAWDARIRTQQMGPHRAKVGLGSVRRTNI